MKLAGLLSKLDFTLCQKVDTRWNSMYMLLFSVHRQFDKIVEILTDKEKADLIVAIDQNLLKELVDFLSLFKETTDDLEADTVPTLPLVLPSLIRLQEHCQIVEAADSECIKKIKLRATFYLKEKVENVLDINHYLATFLNPNFRSLGKLDEEQILKIHTDARNKCTLLTVTRTDDQHEDVPDSQPPPVKKFKGWDEKQPVTPRDEITRYLDMEIPSDEVNSLIWWKTRSAEFPRLSRLARKLLCIPASSAASERAFSRAGLVVTEKRSTLESETVNDILVIHCNRSLIG